MKIINHPLCTTTIGAPSDMQGDCSALPVAYHTDNFGTWAVSFWQPGADELAMLIAGGGITLQVRAAGRQNPVVAMGVYPSTKAPAAAPDDGTQGVAQARAVIAAALDESMQQRLERVEAELAAANEQVTDLIAIVAQQVALPFGEVPMLYPRTMTPALEHVLGVMNFRTGPIAHVFQKAGFAIPTKCEAEQAFVLDRMIRAVLTHGEGWGEVFNADVRAQLGIIEAKKIAAQAAS